MKKVLLIILFLLSITPLYAFNYDSYGNSSLSEIDNQIDELIEKNDADRGTTIFHEKLRLKIVLKEYPRQMTKSDVDLFVNVTKLMKIEINKDHFRHCLYYRYKDKKYIFFFQSVLIEYLLKEAKIGDKVELFTMLGSYNGYQNEVVMFVNEFNVSETESNEDNSEDDYESKIVSENDQNQLFTIMTDSDMPKQNSKELIDIFDDFTDLIKKNKIENKVVIERVNFIKNKIEKKKLLLTIRNDLPKNIGEGIKFYGPHAPEVIPFIGISPYFLDIYKKHPSIVYSALIHEFQHAFNFFNNKNYITTYDNNLEKYLYEMDALYLESLLIKDYLSDNFKLTPLEEYLKVSLIKDNLNSFSIAFKDTNMNLAYGLFDLSRMEDSNKSIQMITELATKIKNSFNFTSENSEWNNYQEIVNIYTCLKYLPQILYNITLKEKKYLSPKKFSVASQYPQFSKLLIEMENMIKPHMEFYNEYRTTLFKDYEKLE